MWEPKIIDTNRLSVDLEPDTQTAFPKISKMSFDRKETETFQAILFTKAHRPKKVLAGVGKKFVVPPFGQVTVVIDPSFLHDGFKGKESVLLRSIVICRLVKSQTCHLNQSPSGRRPFR